MLFFMIVTTNLFAQVGIGTITPNASSVLDVTSTTQGMLTPRMTTAQKNAIASPADGLMVYDTDLKSFHYYNQAALSWTVINSATTGRLKFKRIRSTDVLATALATELAAGGGIKYVLDSGTYYEINGTIILNFPIDMNNCYISGQDANEDKLVRTSGNLFDGALGGTIRNVTIQVTGGECVGRAVMQLCRVFGEVKKLIAIDFWVPDEFPVFVADHALAVSICGKELHAQVGRIAANERQQAGTLAEFWTFAADGLAERGEQVVEINQGGA